MLFVWRHPMDVLHFLCYVLSTLFKIDNTYLAYNLKAMLRKKMVGCISDNFEVNYMAVWKKVQRNYPAIATYLMLIIQKKNISFTTFVSRLGGSITT